MGGVSSKGNHLGEEFYVVLVRDTVFTNVMHCRHTLLCEGTFYNSSRSVCVSV